MLCRQDIAARLFELLNSQGSAYFVGDARTYPQYIRGDIDEETESAFRKASFRELEAEIIRTPTKAGRLLSLNRAGGRWSANQIGGLSSTRRLPSASVPRESLKERMRFRVKPFQNSAEPFPLLRAEKTPNPLEEISMIPLGS